MLEIGMRVDVKWDDTIDGKMVHEYKVVKEGSRIFLERRGGQAFDNYDGTSIARLEESIRKSMDAGRIKWIKIRG